jgi:hypothetical protein
MRKAILSLMILGLFLFSCKKKHELIEVQRIEYDVLLNNYGNNYSWFDHIEGFTRISLFQHILDAAMNGKFRLEDSKGNEISPDRINEYLKVKWQSNDTDSVFSITPENLNGLRFRESWTVNSGTGKIEKEVIAICPLFFQSHLLINDKPFSEAVPLFWIYPDLTESIGGDAVVVQNIAYDVILDNSLSIVRESYGEYLPFYFFNIEPVYRSLIIDAILDAGLKKKNKVYDFTFSEVNEQDRKLIETREETHSLWNDEKGQMMDTVMTQKLDRSQVLRLKFAEQWSIDKLTLQITKKVIAVAPSVISYDEQGEFKGFRFLFWLVFEPGDFKKLKLI